MEALGDHNSRMARRDAYRLNRNLFPRAASYKEDYPDFVVAGHKSFDRVLTVGTDCSGMEVPIIALKNLGVPYRHVFSCDCDAAVKQQILANYPPEIFYDNIITRNNSKTPYVDLYVAGFPCQPFSIAGKQQGFHDEQGRGTIIYNIIDYLKHQKPKIFILENVKGLVTLQNGQYLKMILDELHSIGATDAAGNGNASDSRARGELKGIYEIQHQVLNTKDHGIPHTRKGSGYK